MMILQLFGTIWDTILYPVNWVEQQSQIVLNFYIHISMVFFNGIMNYKFLTTETNSKAFYIFPCFFNTVVSAVKKVAENEVKKMFIHFF